MSDGPSIRLWFENLVVLKGDGEQVPLAALLRNEDDVDIHGGLRIQLGERTVPHLGFLAPDDVCLNAWLWELFLIARAFESSESGQHTFDDGEQGQPAFKFERAGERGYLSIIEGTGGGDADPAWQHIEFSAAEFLAEHARFRESFFTLIRREAPSVAELWIRDYDPAVRLA